MDLLDNEDFDGQNFFDDLENDLGEDINEFEDNFIQDFLSEEDRMEFLNNNDYNLNSPIITEHIIELVKFIKGQQYNPIFFRQSWIIFKDLYKKGKINEEISYIDKDYLHVRLFDFIRNPPILGNYKYADILRKSLKHHNLSKEFLQIWFKKWGHSDVLDNCNIWENYNRLLSREFLWWSEIFYDSHVLTLHMNCSGKKEAKNLVRIFNSTPLLDKNKKLMGFIWNSNTMGELLILPDYILCNNLSSIWDRPFLLMIKDVTMSRVQSITSMTFSIDPVYSDLQIKKLIDLYNYGDDFIYKVGNLSYDGLKLLEPICNLQLCKLAHDYRPLIPEFPEFGQHVWRSINEKSFNTYELFEIFRLITEEDNLDMVLNYYSIFRHWGHPNIDYFEGLQKLHDQVNMVKTIDDDYAQKLASDLAYKILKKNYFGKKKWFVDPVKISDKHPLKKHITNSTWPNQFEIEDFGDNWHQLPITKIFDIPDLIDPSLIYSDKSHSMDRDEVIDFVSKNPGKAIPTRRVLQTMLNKPATDWKSFLQKINDIGLSLKSLIIGLKAKEREMKRIGRFFSLMSWELREYFVFTEYLIKEYFVPLFHGLTMADDLQSVIKKMLENSQGQGSDNYEYVSIANHIDYEKWNNHQRKESNYYVFKVMGQCFGLPNLFTRTHEFFEQSLVYYPQRADLMTVNGNTLDNFSEYLVCWNGQKGGLEGLRQKGWSVLNYLVIERESRIRNTKVKVLAQGDNQTISTFYHLQSHFDDRELIDQLHNICKNNKAIMNAIEQGTTKLGLIINRDETMISADYLNYGKVPIFRGVIRGLHLKRWSRVNCVTNDQVPSLSNSLASCATNALTVSHYSEDPLNAIYLHSVFGNITITLLLEYNPALRTSVKLALKDPDLVEHVWFRLLLLYLDPSLGGISGTSLTRFLIRMFPDPLTESLSFWKFIHDNCYEPNLQNLCSIIGNPSLMEFQIEHLDKLIENPTSINLVRGISAANLIKNEVKANLIESIPIVSNQIIKHALEYTRDEEQIILQWARSIKPLFPRFLSEMVNSTYYGITTSLIGLFQNSKTIRSQFKKKYHKRIDDVVFRSEIIGISSLLKIIKIASSTPTKIWTCSSSQADYLRKQSWGQDILGMTIPHPLEMLGTPDNMTNLCSLCKINDVISDYIAVMIPKGFSLSKIVKGPYPPYLGSKTSESTSIIQPWEKETNIPLIKRASKLRNAISWFIEPESNLAKSIMENMKSLTGEDWGDGLKGFKRTGSALHRYSCSRVSNGGFCASSPAKFMWMICTTDTMSNLTGKNYDFMFQSLLIYSQSTGGVIWGNRPDPVNLHFHIKCVHCIREIGEPILESDWVLKLPSVSHILNAWRPDSTKSWGEEKMQLDVPSRNWERVNPGEKTYHVGFIMGFIFTDMLLSHSKHVSDSSLFPLGISKKLIPKAWFDGLIMGIQKSCALQISHRRNLLELKKPRVVQWGSSYFTIEKICESPGFLGLVRDGPLFQEIISVPHKVPASYPLNNFDLGALSRNYLKTKLFNIFENPNSIKQYDTIWTFADLQSHEIIGSLALSHIAYKLIMDTKKNKHFQNQVRLIQNAYISIKNGDWDKIDQKKALRQVSVCDQEVRHSCKFDIGPFVLDCKEKVLNWEDEYVGDITCVELEFTHELETKTSDVTFSRRFCPLISGLRTFQMATGSHYKIRTIIKRLNLKWSFGLVCGDGSGGVASYLCRSNPFGEVVFNSLLELDGIDFKGSHPSPPPAITALGSIKNRCINHGDCWQAPSDLSNHETWNYFGKLARERHKKYDLIIIEADISDIKILRQTREFISSFAKAYLSDNGSLICRGFLENLWTGTDNITDLLCRTFKEIKWVQTNLSSNFTQEVYVVFQHLNTYPDNRYINWKSLHKKILDFYCFQTNAKEFERSLLLSKSNLMIGVPNELVVSPNIELSSILTRIGLETGFAVSITKSWIRNLNKNAVNYVLAVNALVFESVIPITRRSKKRISPPSNQSIELVLGFLFGSYLWISLNVKSLPIYNWLVDKLCDHVDLYISYHLKDSKREIKYCLSWNLSKPDSIDMVWKRIRLHRQSTLIGNVIRCWQRMYSVDDRLINEEQVDKILSFYNKGLNTKILKSSSSIFL
ncbi:polymerase [Holmes Jungle virus]|uniref:Replicase n=1 Tax=Holmes Jungle virus TaxID=2021721 RepID=A0A221LCI4_9RHAB|nr:polymerase [Holmes Jungle virus]ASM90779.1 polymerase [Holmes Jungle virus]